MDKITVLVAIDFSEASFTVLAKALSMLERCGGELHVVHVIEESWYALAQEMQSIHEHTWSLLSSTFPELQKKFFHCLQGNITREIAETADAIGATMIVIGGSGENYLFKELLLGSTTKNIVRNATVPVLIIKNALPLLPKRILIPTNFSDHSKTAIQQTAALFPAAELILLYAYILPFEGRLKTYGFGENEIIDYHTQIKIQEDEKAAAFSASLQLPRERVQIMMRKEPLSPSFFLDISALYQTDFISIHTSGSFSFFAFDLLEESPHDVLIFSF